MVGTEDENNTGGSHANGSLNNSRRASARLGKPDEPKPEDGRLAGRRESDKLKKTLKQSPTTDGPKLGSSGLTDQEVELTATGSFAIPPKDYKPTDHNKPGASKPAYQSVNNHTPAASAADSTQDIQQLSKNELEALIDQPPLVVPVRQGKQPSTTQPPRPQSSAKQQSDGKPDDRPTISVVRRIPASSRAPSARPAPATPAYTPHTEDEELRREPNDPFHSVKVTAGTPQPAIPQEIGEDTRFMIEEDAKRVRDSRKFLAPAKRNDYSAITEGDTDKLPPVGKKAQAGQQRETAGQQRETAGQQRETARQQQSLYKVSSTQKEQTTPLTGQPDNPTEADYAKDSSGSRRVYLSQRNTPRTNLPEKPRLTLTQKVEAALAGKRDLDKKSDMVDTLTNERQVAPFLDGRIDVRLVVDNKEQRIGIHLTEPRASDKNRQKINLLYEAPRDSRKTARDVRVTLEQDYLAHHKQLDDIAIPDATANWQHACKMVQGLADAALLGSAGLALYKSYLQAEALARYRCTISTFINKTATLARTELDAREATRLILIKGKEYADANRAPYGTAALIDQTISRYDELIRLWRAAYSCTYQIAEAFGTKMTGRKAIPPTGDTMTLAKDAAGKTTAARTKPNEQ